MELPLITDLTPTEKNARVQIDSKDSSSYPQMYQWTFSKILKYLSQFSAEQSKERKLKGQQSNWDLRYDGYVDWAELCQDEGMNRWQQMMETQLIYKFGDYDFPEVQIKKMFAAPIERLLNQHSKTDEHRALQEKIFVMKYSLSPYSTRCTKEWNGGSNDVRVWRLISCFGETNLSTFHDRILGPSMGWARHYHSYKFIVPTNGACFGPKGSDAVDEEAHTTTSYTLDTDQYEVCHVLREPGQRLIYVYDLGEFWVHTIELIQVSEKGDMLQMPSDEQVKADLIKRYNPSLPVLSGVQLLAGEVNCPPEDSKGCKIDGTYGNMLKEYISMEGARSLNWCEHGIRGPLDFDFQAHVKRLADAISGKGSLKTGHKKAWFTLPFMESGPNIGVKPGPGEIMKETPMGTVKQGPYANGTATGTEIFKVRPDDPAEAVCALCGRQPSVDNGKTPLLRCARCKSTRYCGVDCQKSDWKNHMVKCSQMRKDRLSYIEDLKLEKEKKQERNSGR